MIVEYDVSYRVVFKLFRLSILIYLLLGILKPFSF